MDFQEERRRDDARNIEDNWINIDSSLIKTADSNIEVFLNESALKLSDFNEFIEVSTFSQNRVLPFKDKNGKFGVFISNLQRLPKPILEKYTTIISCEQILIDNFMNEHWNTSNLKINSFLNDKNFTAVGLVKMILQKMIDAKASDLTFSSQLNSVNIAYSVAGKNNTSIEDFIPKILAEKIRVSIINMAGENQAEKIVDGGFATRIAGIISEFRISYIETSLGFSLVLRSYKSFNINQKVSDLGYLSKPLSIVKNIINDNSYGIFLITGPTGSGKTTTIYTLINEENMSKDLKIKTAEDPVEVVVPGIDQCSINKKGDEKHIVTYQRLLEVFMRQKPDIIVIGEIRNKEVAISTVEAALTGHIVISTLHTNNVSSTFTRLTSNLGITEDRIEDSFSGILSQRLVDKLCDHCKELDDNGGYKAGKGCDCCHKTPGYNGLILSCEIAHMYKGHQNFKKENFKEYYSYADSANDLYTAGLIDSRTKKMIEIL